jgi:hypothetical protein
MSLNEYTWKNRETTNQTYAKEVLQTGWIDSEGILDLVDNGGQKVLKCYDAFGEIIYGDEPVIQTGVWNLDYIPNKIAWYDATDSNTITFGVSGVTQWDDKSGNDYHVTQATDLLQPKAGENTINGLTTINFDGEDDVLRNSSVDFANNGNHIMFVVASVQDITGVSSFNSMWSLGSGGATYQMDSQTDGSFQARIRATGFNGGQTSNQGSNGPHNGPSIYCVELDFDTNNAYLHVDGVLRANFSSYIFEFNASDFKIGENRGTGSNLSCNIGEILVMDEADENTRQLIEGYLAWKWGIENKLQDEHPYRYNGTLFGYGIVWNPSYLNTLAAWYDAHDVSTITFNSDQVVNWADKSSNGVDLEQGTGANQPLYRDVQTNDLSVISFDGSNDIMTASTSPFGSPVISGGIEDAFVIFVFKATSTAGSGQKSFGLNNSINEDYIWAGTLPKFQVIEFDVGESQSSQKHEFVQNDSYIMEYYSSIQDNIMQLFEDGLRLSQNSSPDSVGILNGLALGGTGSNVAQKAFGEFIVLNGVVSVGERLKLEGYLAHKWGLTDSLMSSHPYKIVAPSTEDVLWTPHTSIDNKYFWLDASNEITITEGISGVSSWENMGDVKAAKPDAQIRDALPSFTQTTESEQPLTNVATINGLNTVTFSNASGHNISRTSGTAGTKDDFYIFTVLRPKLPSTASQDFLSFPGGDCSISVPASDQVRFNVGTGGSGEVSASYTSTDPVMFCFYNSTTDSVQEIYQNGTFLAGDANGHSFNFSFKNIFLGGGSAGTTTQDCDLGEIIMVFDTLDTTTRQKIEGYLAHKWGLEGNLPSDHPYKSEAPLA